jgi:hypothetical protein
MKRAKLLRCGRLCCKFFVSKGDAMKIDNERIDDAVPALLHLGLHDECRAWKGFDWTVMNRLYEKGFISDPVNKAKSVGFTDEGLRRSEELFRRLFMAEAPKL